MCLISYHNDESLKMSIISDIRRHNESCSLEDDGQYFPILDSKSLEESFGIPEWIIQMHSLLSFKLTKEEIHISRIDLLKSIPVGINLEPIKYKFLIFLLNECIIVFNGTDHIEKSMKKGLINDINLMVQSYEGFVRLMVWNHEEEKEQKDRFVRDLSLMSRSLKISLMGYSKEEYIIDSYKIYLKKLSEMLKHGTNELFFQFKNEKQEKELTIKVVSEYTPLIDSKPPERFRYFKSLIKRML